VDEVVGRAVPALDIVEGAVEEDVAFPVDEAVAARDLLFYFGEIDAPGLREAGGVGWDADAGADLLWCVNCNSSLNLTEMTALFDGA